MTKVTGIVWKLSSKKIQTASSAMVSAPNVWKIYMAIRNGSIIEQIKIINILYWRIKFLFFIHRE